MEKQDNCINHVIEDIVTKNIDSHFFVKNEESNKVDDDAKSNSDINSEEFFKLKADEDKVSEHSLNNDSKQNINIKTQHSNNPNSEHTKTNHDNHHTEPNAKTDINDQQPKVKSDTLNPNIVSQQLSHNNEEDDIRSHQDSKTEHKKVTNVQQQEQDEMEYIKFKEHVDSFKMELMQMNKNLNAQYDKFKDTSLTI